MRSIIVLFVAVSFAGSFAAQAQETKPIDYKTALSACSGEWKAVKKESGAGGRDQWQMFRAKCVADKGYKAGGKSAAPRISNEEFAKLLAKGTTK